MRQNTTLGARLRAIRSERGFSQRELAEQAGLSANAISLIERDENSPSVATLQSLAGALGVKISYFFEEDSTTDVLFVKAGDRPALEGKGVRIEAAGTRLSQQELEPFVITLKPHAGSGGRPVVHTGHEMVYCLQGQIEYIIDGETYSLGEEDLLIFEAHLPHIWQNPTEQKAKMLIILQTPSESDDAVQQHFSSYPSLQHLG